MDPDSAAALDPPRDEIPVAAGTVRTLTASASGRLSTQPVLVHSTGLLVGYRVDLASAPRPGSRAERDLRGLFLSQSEDLGLTLGFRYADGQWRSTVPGRPEHLPAAQAVARMSLVTGHSRGPVVTVTFWCWPPTDGDLVLFGAWPALGLGYAETVVPGRVLAAARRRVI